MYSIGGYFELELNKGQAYHPEAIALNSARSCLEYLIKVKELNKIYLPYFTCGAVYDVCKKNGLQLECYNIDNHFEPIFDYQLIKPREAFLYTNYFGLKDLFVSSLTKHCPSLIVDNAQAFYSKALPGVDSIYSPRKFFGVPDGGYLYTNRPHLTQLAHDSSAARCSHLLNRIDDSAEVGYADFQRAETMVEQSPLLQMSKLTHALLCNVNYADAALKRQDNFNVLNAALGQGAKFNWSMDSAQVPMVYPYYSTNLKLRDWLIQHKVYTPLYWQEVLSAVPENSIEADYVRNVVYLPIDQRYGRAQMHYILELIDQCK